MKLKSLVLSLALLVSLNYVSAQRKGYWQQAVDYKMDIDVNEKTFQYEGKMTLKYSNNSGQALSKVYFHLYFNASQAKSRVAVVPAAMGLGSTTSSKVPSILKDAFSPFNVTVLIFW